MFDVEHSWLNLGSCYARSISTNLRFKLVSERTCTVSYGAKYYFYPERQLALAKPMGQEGVSRAVARSIVKEAAPELKFTPEHVEIVRMAGQSQVCLTKVDSRIKQVKGSIFTPSLPRSRLFL
jgi:hypothetical protein